MSAYPKPRLLTFLAGGTIALGHAVKFGSDDKTVVECTASTDASIGVAAGATTTVGDPIEVFMPGGGGKVALHTTIARGSYVAPYTDGTGNTPSTSDRVHALTLASGVAGDIVPCQVVSFKTP